MYSFANRRESQVKAFGKSLPLLSLDARGRGLKGQKTMSESSFGFLWMASVGRQSLLADVGHCLAVIALRTWDNLTNVFLPAHQILITVEQKSKLTSSVFPKSV